ncbi:hypothetical protein VNO78_23617 [Psophocarpus tetragonolobus]|uniref:Uncharacterized protein n=1 Tax=Psophocarpus tetragonolobus TaxID=3891 RepID=A0AAN9S4T8_PSOTE
MIMSGTIELNDDNNLLQGGWRSHGRATMVATGAVERCSCDFGGVIRFIGLGILACLIVSISESKSKTKSPFSFPCS